MTKSKWIVFIMVLIVMVIFAMPVKVIAGATSTKVTLTDFESPGHVCIADFDSGFYLNGSIHFLVKNSVDSQGCLHMVIHENAQKMTAEGYESGNIYQVKWAETTSAKLCGGYPYVYTVSGMALLVSPGGDVPNHVVPYIYHMTMNANGEVKVEFLKINDMCK